MVFTNKKNGKSNSEKEKDKDQSTISSWLTGRVACLFYGGVGAYAVYWTGILPKLIKKLPFEYFKKNQQSDESREETRSSL